MAESSSEQARAAGRKGKAATEAPRQGGPRRLEIRKYPNRRYYDTTHSRHVTLEEIYTMIRDGWEVRVVDSKTGQDITAKVLAQIIIELDPPKLDVFPVPLLHRLLRSNEQLVNDFIQKYFNAPLSAFLDSHRNFEQSLRQAMGLQLPTPTVADWAKMMWGPFNPSLWSGQRNSTSAARPEGPAASPPPEQDLRQEVEELRQRLSQLQQQVGSAKPGRKPRGRAY
jgi:polyhydroxyalkanoate synthesis repressor PhaR